MLKALVRRFTPEPIISAYHFVLANLAAFAYGHPSEELIVIGVTGTNGKSSTTHFIGKILEHAGERVGWTTTVDFKVAEREWPNDKKMTMLGRFQSQRLLREMVKAGCKYAVIETSSQGIAQSRHVGINYDVAVFTNLTPEHIESHGGFENYKKAKGRLFSHTAAGAHKPGLEKMSVVNIDDEFAPYFLSFKTGVKYGYGLGQAKSHDAFVPVIASNVASDRTCSTFTVEGHDFHLKPFGSFNVYNGLAAIATCRALGLSWEVIQDGVGKLLPVPGRLELIDEGQPFLVVVDYAYEPAALQAAYDALSLMKAKRIIHVTGSAGGGRDIARREVLGRMAAEHDAVVIVTNEDPYDDDPMQIINDVAGAAKKAGKVDGENLWRIQDRQEAINKAVALAQPGDLVLLSGKGCEPVMAVAHGRKEPWDDRLAARKALHENGYAH
jgi:UDP-N-acetylmuramoyl-L-alanyl-D-glutamate--2,6-diaminopimelate ligase